MKGMNGDDNKTKSNKFGGTMNFQDFETRWNGAHPNDIFLPPYFGGPIDEIFLDRKDEIKTETEGVSPEVTPPRRPFSRHLSKGSAHPRQLSPSTLAPHPFRHPFYESDEQPIEKVIGCWIRVSNVPDHLFHMIYDLFTHVGTLETMRAYNNHTFYVLYSKPEDTLRAASLHEQRVTLSGEQVELHIDLLKQWQIDKIYSRHTNFIYDDDCSNDISYEADPSYEPYCTERFVYADEYEQEYNDRHNCGEQIHRFHFDDYEDGDDYDYESPESKTENENVDDLTRAQRVKYFLRMAWRWAKFKFGAMINFMRGEFR